MGDVLATFSGHLEDLARSSSTSLLEGAVLESPATTHLAQEQRSIPCAAMFVDTLAPPLCKSARWHFPLQILFCQAPQLCCTLVAKSVEWTATPAGANSEGQRQTKAAQKEDPILFRIHL